MTGQGPTCLTTDQGQRSKVKVARSRYVSEQQRYS